MTENFITLLESFKESNIPDSLNFDKMNEILISHHSTAIEGSSLTEDETRLLLTDGITAKGKSLLDHNMVTDHHKALLGTIKLARDNQQMSVETLKQLSAMVMLSTGGVINASAGSYDSSKGDFRKSMVYVGTRYFANYQKVPGEVEILCQHINKRISIVKTTEEIYNLAFDSHFGLVSIHPWADGNGRVARLLMNYILAYHGQPLAIIFNEDKVDYFRTLESSRKTENIQPFRDFMFCQQIKYFQQELNKLDISIQRSLNFEI
jgi:Fic family protein